MTSTDPAATFRPILKSQYHAGLAMLTGAVERCPENLWNDPSYPNRFWHVAYHALFFAHLYLHPDRQSFRPWAKHRDEYHFLGRIPTPPHRPPNIGEPYTKPEILEYGACCDAFVDGAVDRLDLLAAASGFPWYPISKLEHQLVSLRHLQHHAAQLADRLRTRAGVGVDWIWQGSAAAR